MVIVGAGFTFNWGLVQPEVAKLTQVCSYDHSGIGWSDDGPKDSCSLRVSEVHTALKNAGIKGPYVLVGHSLGGLVARLCAGRYPDEVAGMVFVDHAMHFALMLGPPPPGDAKVPPPMLPPMPSTPSGGGGIESDPNFSKLSSRDRELHLWAMSQRLASRLVENAHGSSSPHTSLAGLSREHSPRLSDIFPIGLRKSRTLGLIDSSPYGLAEEPALFHIMGLCILAIIPLLSRWAIADSIPAT